MNAKSMYPNWVYQFKKTNDGEHDILHEISGHTKFPDKATSEMMRFWAAVAPRAEPATQDKPRFGRQRLVHIGAMIQWSKYISIIHYRS